MNKSRLKRIGGLWIKERPHLENFISGELILDDEKKVRILAFKNSNRNKSQPDYIVYIPEKEESASS